MRSSHYSSTKYPRKRLRFPLRSASLHNACSSEASRNGVNLLTKSLIRIFSVALIVANTETSAMSILDAGKVCTFSRISGVILRDGKPLQDVTITRTTSYQDKKSDQTKTDSKGFFELPAVFERNAMSLLPQEFLVGQLLQVAIDGEEITIWEGVKRSKEENSEARGKHIAITCDIESENHVIEVNNQPFITKCQWNVVPDSVDKGF